MNRPGHVVAGAPLEEVGVVSQLTFLKALIKLFRGHHVLPFEQPQSSIDFGQLAKGIVLLQGNELVDCPVDDVASVAMSIEQLNDLELIQGIGVCVVMIFTFQLDSNSS